MGSALAQPLGSEFVFARLRYDSGDWDYNPKVAANVLNSIVEYTSIPVYPEEIVITADSEELLSFPFLFMTGHKLVRFSREERERLRDFVQHGGLLFSDDCNHDVNGLYAKSFEHEMRTIFPASGTLALTRIVNDEPQVPFGGVKGSGYGRFGGQAALDEFTELRWINVQRTKRTFP